MLVDLARNDLSRNAFDVRVETFKEIQYYSHVLHMVSTVSGTLPKEFNLFRLIGNTFPAGTLSGAPKIRAMELIHRYEATNRGFYGGCIGQMGFDRSVNQAIMIRSFLSIGNRLVYQAGAGIVADSSEESELQEVNKKLEALRLAVELADRG
jgi:anthranilate synthase component 1